MPFFLRLRLCRLYCFDYNKAKLSAVDFAALHSIASDLKERLDSIYLIFVMRFLVVLFKKAFVKKDLF